MTSQPAITPDGTIADPGRYANFGPAAGTDDGWQNVWSVNHGYYGASDGRGRYQLLDLTTGAQTYAALTSWAVEATDAGWLTEADATRIWALRDKISAAVRASGRNHLRLRVAADGTITNYDNGQPVGQIGDPR